MLNTLNKLLIEDFEKAVKKLEEVLKLEKTDVTRDSAIKRFEICFDLSWKLIKNFAREEGIECNSPRSCFKTAFQLKLINYDENWLKMIDDRNKIVHIYKEKLADKIYSHLPAYLRMFKILLDNIKKVG